MPDRNVKRLAHPLLRLAYRAYAWWVKLKGQPLRAAAVAVWHGGEFLVVRHPYRRGLFLPGGLLRKGEDPRLAGADQERGPEEPRQLGTDLHCLRLAGDQSRQPFIGT